MYATYLQRMVNSYMDCADWTEEERLWEEAQEIGVEIMGWHADAVVAAERECLSFLLASWNDDDDDPTVHDVLVELGIGPEFAGLNLWLSRNDHGTGWWDRDLGSDGDRLHSMSTAMGSSDPYIGDDGWQYLA